MLLSMTGYGQGHFETSQYRIHVEMKSVNHRFSEITIRMPRQFLFLEDKLKKEVSQHVHRGKVDVFLTVEGEGLVERTIQVDWYLFEEFIRVHEAANKKLATIQSPSVDKILSLPDVVNILEKENHSDSLVSEIINTCQKATSELLEMRKREGEILSVDLKNRLSLISNNVQLIMEQAPKVVDAYHERLLKRVEDFVNGKLEIDETRILTEVAIFADKANIEEELTRLTSHIEQFLFIMNEKTPVGRKLDFLVQEMNREVNTIGSKSNDVFINKLVVELKAEIEKIKEQVQNIE